MHIFFDVCKELDLPTVPLLEEQCILDEALIKKYDEQLSEINGHPFEGVVISGDSFSFKVINKEYDSGK